MADVLHRTDGRYLFSVNTPDYPEQDWIINPDLSAVQGLPQKYWVVEGDSVRAATPEEQAAIDAAAPPVWNHLSVTKLSDGTPAFLYLPSNQILSISETRVTFSSKSKAGARSFSLQSPANAEGFIISPYDFTMVAASAASAKEATDPITVSLRRGGSEIYTLQIPEGSFGAVQDDQVIQINQGDYLTCEVTSDSNVYSPSATFIMRRR